MSAAARANRARSRGDGLNAPWNHDAAGNVMLTLEGNSMAKVSREKSKNYQNRNAPWDRKSGVSQDVCQNAHASMPNIPRTQRYRKEHAPWEEDLGNDYTRQMVSAEGHVIKTVPRDLEKRNQPAPWEGESKTQTASDGTVLSRKAKTQVSKKYARHGVTPWEDEQDQGMLLDADGRTINVRTRPKSSQIRAETDPWGAEPVVVSSKGGTAVLKKRSTSAGVRRRTSAHQQQSVRDPNIEQEVLSVDGRTLIKVRKQQGLEGAGLTSQPWSTTDHVPSRPSSRQRPRSRPGSGKRRISSAVHTLLDPELAHQHEMGRIGVTNSKDHVKENVRKLRETQAQNRRQRQQAEQEKKGNVPRRNSAYRNVASKVTQQLNEPTETDKPKVTTYLRAHSRNGRPSRPASPVVKRPGSAPSKKQQQQQPQSRPGSSKGRRPSSANGQRKKSGEIPAYLKRRKEEWRQEEIRRKMNEPDPDCPPGHVLLPQHIRLADLQEVKEEYEDTLKKLRQIPLSADSRQANAYRQSLEDTLASLEQEKKILSKPKVFVKQ